MRLRSRLLAFASLLPLAALPAAMAPGAARADTAPLTPDQSASLDKAIGLMTGGLAAARDGGAAPYTVAPEGDHYKLTLKLPRELGHTGITLDSTDYTATVRPMDGGRWSFENVQGLLPLTLDTPKDKDGKSLHVAADVKGQTGRIVIDPTLATTSTFDGADDSVSADVTMPELSVQIRTGRSTSHQTWDPAANGRVDVTGTNTLEDLSESLNGKEKFTISAKRVSGQGHATGYAPEKLATLMGVAVDLLKQAPSFSTLGHGDQADGQGGAQTGQQDQPPPAPPPAADNAPGAPTPNGQQPPAGAADVTPPGASAPAAAGEKPKLTADQRHMLHTVLETLSEMYTGFDQTLTLEQVGFEAQGHSVRIHSLSFSQGLSAPGGKADVKMRIAMDGLESPDIPPQIAQNYVPRRFVFAPHISGVPAQVLFDFLSHAIEEDKPSPQEMQALGAAVFSKGPISVALDEVAFDIGPAALTATGSVQAASPDPAGVSGSADIEVKGLDALIRQAGSDPLLKQAGPVLIFLKGIGQDNGHGQTVWKIAYQDSKVLVNGTDMSQLVPH